LRLGYEEVASELTTKTPGMFNRAAKAIIGLRDGLAKWHESHPELVSAMEELAVISFAAYVLHQFGAAGGDTSALIAFAVVKKEKLADLLRGKDKNN
jgi:hypothetical protein